MKIILLSIIIGLVILILTKSKCNEQFIDINSNIVTFTRNDNVLLKNYKINSFYSLYGNELLDLFTNNDNIKINIPLNYSVTIKYSLINDTSIIAKIIELSYGTYDIYKQSSDKIINQIDIKNMIGYNSDLLATSNVNIPVYWDTDLYYTYRPEYYGYNRESENYHHNSGYNHHRFNHHNSGYNYHNSGNNHPRANHHNSSNNHHNSGNNHPHIPYANNHPRANHHNSSNNHPRDKSHK
jgi:hypothetical protein